GLSTCPGHSFSIDGTMACLLSGVPPDVFQALGYWSSYSFLRYWHFRTSNKVACRIISGLLPSLVVLLSCTRLGAGVPCPPLDIYLISFMVNPIRLFVTSA
ncbi:uncharacterized protein F5891DRAFT_957111, partial [Suillus fuscotomentosus]